MYQNPLMRSFQGPRDGSRPESVGAEVIRPSGDSVASGDMTKGPAQALPQGYRNRREAAFANAARRRNPLMAKPIRYDEPKGGYQQPGTRDTSGVSPFAGNDSIRYSQPNDLSASMNDRAAQFAAASNGGGANQGGSQSPEAIASAQSTLQSMQDAMSRSGSGGETLAQANARYGYDKAPASMSGAVGAVKSPAAMAMLRRRQGMV